MLSALLLAVFILLLMVPGASAQDEGILNPVNGSDVIPVVDGSLIPTPGPSPGPSPSPSPVPLILVQGRVLDAQLSVFDQLVPVAGATILFINNSADANNTTAYVAVSDPTGFYSVGLTPGDYTIIASKAGFDTLIEQETFTLARTRNIILFTVPFNGFIPYAVNPVLEVSPGGEVVCTMGILNSQVNDQMVTFNVVTPPGWVAWFPDGEALMVPSGQSSVLAFRLKYDGVVQGAYTMKVVVNGGAYSAEVPVIVVVKDQPYQSIDLYTNSFYKEVSAGSVIRFELHARNKYEQGKHVEVKIEDLPEGWTAKTEDFATSLSTRTNEKYFVYEDSIYDFLLRVYIPPGTPEGTYQMTAVMCGDGVKSSEVPLIIKVNNTPSISANFMDGDASENRKNFTMNKTETLYLNISLKSNWAFPVETQADLRFIDPKTSAYWTSAFTSTSGYSPSSILLLPGKNETITYNVTPQSPVKPGQYKAIITLNSKDAESSYRLGKITLEAYITVNDTAANKTSTKKSQDVSDQSWAELLPFLLVLLIAVAGLLVLFRWLKK